MMIPMITYGVLLDVQALIVDDGSDDGQLFDAVPEGRDRGLKSDLVKTTGAYEKANH